VLSTRLLAFCALIFCTLSLGRVALAANDGYPIPFDERSDLKGYAPVYPSGPTSLALKTHGLRLSWIILVHRAFDQALSSEAAAQKVYKALFVTNADVKYPSGGAYVVMVLFYPKVAEGKIPFVAYIFSRDAAGRWEHRFAASPEDVKKIASVVFHSSNWNPTIQGSPPP
jgi:hypothetical protein